jgi:hypothetical protein
MRGRSELIPTKLLNAVRQEGAHGGNRQEEERRQRPVDIAVRVGDRESDGVKRLTRHAQVSRHPDEASLVELIDGIHARRANDGKKLRKTNMHTPRKPRS